MVYLYHINTFTYLELTGPVIMGRSQGNLTFPEDKSISSKHLQLTIEETDSGPAIFAEDLGSKNFSIINRVQIPANEKVKLGLNAFLEVGEQKFILTNSKGHSIQEINKIIDQWEKKQVMKIDGVKFVKDLKNKALSEAEALEAEEASLRLAISEKEAKVEQSKHEVQQLHDAKDERLKQLKAEEEAIIKQTLEKVSVLNIQMDAVKEEIMDLELKAQKLAEEALAKKKKAEKFQLPV